MAKDSLISTLTAGERTALALCGITQDAQLAGISPAKLHRDLEQAAEFFPGQIGSIPPVERLADICARAAEAAGAAPEVQASPAESDGLPAPGQKNLPTYEPVQGSRKRRRKGGIEENGQTINMAQADKSRDDTRDFSHAIGCAHPWTIYFGAWATLALIAACITIAAILFQLLIGIKLSPAHINVAKAMVGVVVIYYLFLRSATCSTCRIGIYSFRRYPRHRQAHHFPLLGYTIPTALSVIFCLRYRCPSCGTPQKLIGKRRRRH